jgi:hypothetical protein
VSRAMSVWALLAALAAALLGLQSLSPVETAAPAPSAPAQQGPGSEEEIGAHGGDVHRPASDCHSYLIRHRHQTADRCPCADARCGGATVVATLPAADSAPAGDTRRQPRPDKGLTPSALQVIRC